MSTQRGVASRGFLPMANTSTGSQGALDGNSDDRLYDPGWLPSSQPEVDASAQSTLISSEAFQHELMQWRQQALPEAEAHYAAAAQQMHACFNSQTSPGSLTARVLDLSRHDQLISLPEVLGTLKTLQFIILSGCVRLATLPQSLSGLEALKILNVVQCPESLCNAPVLASLLPSVQVITEEDELSKLPKDIASKILHAAIDKPGSAFSCANRAARYLADQSVVALGFKTPQALTAAIQTGSFWHVNIKKLYLKGAFTEQDLETACQAFPNLTTLELLFCKSLTTLPSLDRLTALTTLRLQGCENLKTLPSLDQLTALTTLKLVWSQNLTTLPSFDRLTALTTLRLVWCKSLTNLPSLDQLTALTTLELDECESLTTLPSLDRLTALTKLGLVKCKNLTALPSLDGLTALTKLDLLECENLTTLPSLDRLTALTKLRLVCCNSLTTLPSLDRLTSLTTLNLVGCKSLTTLPSLDQLTSLTTLKLRGCKSLTTLPSLDRLTALTTLELGWCKSLTTLPSLDRLTALNTLELPACENLMTLPSLDQLTALAVLDLRYCHQLSNAEVAQIVSNAAFTIYRPCDAL